MEEMIMSGAQNFSFAEVLCLVLLVKGISSMDRLSTAIQELTIKIADVDKRIDRLERQMLNTERRAEK